MSTATNVNLVSCASDAEWERWLARYHAQSAGCWLRIFKKDSGRASVAYTKALDAALCYGWIDGQKKRHDKLSWLQKFTPRRPKSVWSKINTLRAERLIKAGKMRPAGLKAIEAAKRDGRWRSAYDSPGAAVLPEDFLRELAKNKTATAFFATLNKRNTYAITFRLQSARKPATRERRMKAILAMLAKGEKLYP